MGVDFSQVGIGWAVGMSTGWGTYGSSLAVQLVRQGIEPAIFILDPEIRLPAAHLKLLKPAALKITSWRDKASRGGLVLDFPMLIALGNGLEFADFLGGTRGQPNVGVPFFESAVIPDKNVADAKSRFQLLVAGSTWNAEVMARHGLTHVRTCLQGVDLELFHPGPKTGHFGDRFVVFSGGKLEYRKGQDLAVSAFKRFYQKHNDALLVTAWHNPWPQLAKGFKFSPHVSVAPGIKPDGTLDVGGWLRLNGLPPSSFYDLGNLSNAETPPLLRELDLAVFPNRCEGGTNLVAMECMASGVPVALSRNTGHLDLIRPDNCYSLDMQIPMAPITGKADMEGWGETAIDELVAKMEQAYTDRADAARRGAAGAAFMQDWSWSTQVARLVAALREFS